MNVSTKNDLDYLTATFKRFGVKAKDKTGQQKLYQLGDAVNKTTKGFKNKLVKGDRKSQTNRINIISKTDKPLDRFISIYILELEVYLKTLTYLNLVQ